MKREGTLRLAVVALAAIVCAREALAHGWPAPPAPVSASLNRGGEGTRGGPGSASANSGAGAGTFAGSPAAAKSKSTPVPWNDRMRVHWVASYLPAIPTSGGYGAHAGTVADALRLPPAEGGWVRDGRPILVYSYDAANPLHRRILTEFDEDGRVRAASRFFDCFRVDVGGLGDKGSVKDAKISVYTADGALVGEIAGQRKISGVCPMLEMAWTRQNGAELTNRVTKMGELVDFKARAEYMITRCQVGIVCPDCGHERLDVIELIGEWKARVQMCDRAIQDLLTVAKN